MLNRARYQDGSLRLKERKNGPSAWEFRYYVIGANGKNERRCWTVGNKSKYPTLAAARKAVQGFLLKLNAESPQATATMPTLGTIIDRYIEDELPARYATGISYRSNLNGYIRPKWGDYPLNKLKPMPIELWLKELKLAPKTKAHIRGIMKLLFKCAERWELVEMGKNPMTLVRVKGVSKRLKRPRVLTADEFIKLLPHLKEPYRTMVIVAQCLGLRVSEIMGLQWGDFDFENGKCLVQRSVVHGRVDDVKTEYSRDEVPVDEALRDVLLSWKEQTIFTADSDFLFTNPKTGKPYHQEEIQKNHLKRAAKKAEIGEDIGWHTFRHTYRALLDTVGVPIGVQQRLMRHAQVSTTMNVYGDAYMTDKRDANSKLVETFRSAISVEAVAVAVSGQ